MKSQKAKALLQGAIQDLTNCKRFFSRNPQADFSRKRKLSFEQMVQAILCMRGGSLANEMMDFFGIQEDLATTSAFVQRRSKIFPEAFESLFNLFTQKVDEDKRYEGMRLLYYSSTKTRSNPSTSGNAVNDLGRQCADGIAKAINNLIQRCKNLVTETHLTKFFPYLLNRVHFRRVRRNEEQLYVFRYAKRSGFVPCRSVAAQENHVIRILL